MRIRPVIVITALCVGGLLTRAVSAQTPPPETLPLELFAYDPPDMASIREFATEQRGDVTVHSLSYPSLVPGSDVTTPVFAYLVTPAGEGPFSAVLFAHWLGNVHSSREEFLDEAVVLAENGVVSLLVNDVFTYSNWYTGDIEHDTTVIVRQIVDFRQGIDILLAQPGVDPDHLVFVGHDYGAMYGAVLAAVETRVQGFVFMAGTSQFSNWPPYVTKRNDAEYVAAFAPFDPLTTIPQVQVPSLLQFGSFDQWVQPDAREQLIAAAPAGAQVVVYEGIAHNLVSEQASADRTNWLLAVLAGDEPPDLSATAS